jgi:Protein of unknown function (DUF3489)
MQGMIAVERETILLRFDWLTGSIGALLDDFEEANARFAVLPCRGFARAGLRWCGGWRRITSEDPMTKSKSKSKTSTRSAARTTGKSKRRPRCAHSSKISTRPETKHTRILAMLRTPAGATIAAIMVATEWQQHSVRGFLAGVVRKKLGLNLVSEQTDKGRVYRIKDSKASAGAADRVKQAA